MSQTEQALTNRQKNLLIDRKINLQMEVLIPKMQKVAESYKLGKYEHSQFRNVLNVATESGSGIEVTKNYIRYQLGRKESGDIWRAVANGDKKPFAVALVEKIEALNQNAENVVKSMGEDMNTDSGKESLQQAHLRLMRLYLGNLARYQVFLARENKG